MTNLSKKGHTHFFHKEQWLPLPISSEPTIIRLKFDYFVVPAAHHLPTQVDWILFPQATTQSFPISSYVKM